MRKHSLNDWHEHNKHHVWPAVIAAAAAVGSGAMNIEAQAQENRRSRQMANRQQEWQGMMANTAHQREVADLQAAGLNPILSAGGNGAATPSGAAATGLTAPQIDMPGMFEAISLQQEQQKIDIQKEAVGAQIAATVDSRELTRAKTALQKKGLPNAMLQGEAAKALGELINHYRKNWKGIKQGYQMQDPNVPGPKINPPK